jgi:hypothetical protein
VVGEDEEEEAGRRRRVMEKPGMLRLVYGVTNQDVAKLILGGTQR